MDLSRYAELFQTESQEHLLTINEALLELERNGFDASAIDRFFRAVHTIKGMSATMGYSAVAQLSHEMESLLSEVRDGSRPLDGDLLDPLFQATDALENAVAACAAGNADSLDLSDALKSLVAVRSVIPAKAGIQVPVIPAKAGIHSGSEPAVGLRVEIRLRKDTQLPGVRAFLIVGRLRSLGNVTAIHPDEAAMQGEGFDGVFGLTIATSRSHAELREAILSSGDVDAVSIGGEAPLTVSRSADATAKSGGEPSSGVSAAGELVAERRSMKHVRVEQRRLDALMNLVGELVIARGRLMQRSEELRDPELEEALAGASRQITDLQDEIMASRMVPVWQVFDRFPRLVRDAARSLDKKVDFVMEGRDIELDRSLLEEIGDPLVHLLRNAVDHGIEPPEERLRAGKGETGRLVLSAQRDREAVLVTVSDDGKGIDREKIAQKARGMNLISGESNALTDDQLFSVISTSGFSTASSVTDISGRGVGVDAVITKVRSLGGTVDLRSAKGEGTSVTIRLPLTLAIIRAMLARAGDETYALPLTNVAETVEIDTSAFRTVRGRQVTILRDEILPLIRLRDVVRLPLVPDERRQMVVLEVGSKRAGLVVDDLVGQQEIVVKQFDAVREALPLFSGATILGNGELALIVDVGSII